MHLKYAQLWKCLLMLTLLLPFFAGDVEGRVRTSALNEIRVADYVEYTHICLELSGAASKVTIQRQSSGKYPVLTVKLSGVNQGSKPSQFPVDSEVLLSNISLKYTSSSRSLTLTIPCRESVDLTKILWHKWSSFVTIDLPLKTGYENHTKIPTREEIQRFRDNGGKVVVIDAGHGAWDSGATGGRYTKYPRLKEKDMVLDIAKRLEKLFMTNPKTMVFLTRYGDYFPIAFGLTGYSKNEYRKESLSQRVKMAKEFQGDVYLSLHLNSIVRSKQRYTRGFSIYYMGNEQADNISYNPDIKDWESTSINEKQADGLSELMTKLTKESIPEKNALLAGAITQEMKKLPWMPIKDNPMLSHRGFVVIKHLQMPSVLIEFAYISHKDDHELIRSDSKRSQMAAAVYKGVCQHLFEPSKRVYVATTALPKPKPKAMPTPKKPTSSYRTYLVRSGDSLDKIARKYRTTVLNLKALNGFKAKNPKIYPGNKIKVPASGSVRIASAKKPLRYTVRSGDSLDKIAKRYSTSVTKIKRLNGFKAKNPKIYPGDKIRVR